MAEIDVKELSIYFPIIGADNRSLKRYLKQVAIGGGLARKSARSSQPLLVALRDVSFNLKSGDRLGLVGSNGSGKTTLLRIIAGLDANRYDTVINEVGITDKRKEKFAFSDPYIASRAVLSQHTEVTVPVISTVSKPRARNQSSAPSRSCFSK